MPFFYVELREIISILVIPIYCKRFQYCLKIERYFDIINSKIKGTFYLLGKSHNSTNKKLYLNEIESTAENNVHKVSNQSVLQITPFLKICGLALVLRQYTL